MASAESSRLICAGAVWLDADPVLGVVPGDLLPDREGQVRPVARVVAEVEVELEPDPRDPVRGDGDVRGVPRDVPTGRVGVRSGRRGQPDPRQPEKRHRRDEHRKQAPTDLDGPARVR
jgi:hypothetical protein